MYLCSSGCGKNQCLLYVKPTLEYLQNHLHGQEPVSWFNAHGIKITELGKIIIQPGSMESLDNELTFTVGMDETIPNGNGVLLCTELSELLTKLGKTPAEALTHLILVCYFRFLFCSYLLHRLSVFYMSF